MGNELFSDLTQRLRAVVGTPRAESAIRSQLEQTVADPGPLLAATENLPEDEIMYFEDEHLSIWHCRFQPDFLMPPHEHKLKVFIAGYSGVERSILYQRTDQGLVEKGTVDARAGEVIELGQNAIHAVRAAEGVPSYAIHVYLGPLMQLKRDLYDWDSGKAVEFSMDNFEAMKRSTQ
jgi:predicted metal-dependent enzyme (double-stranded beta helix superfamily)